MKHVWRKVSEVLSTETASYKVCLNCGVVKRADGKNSPCKGKVKIGLRGKKNAV